jgi:hypothetical protein
VQAKPKRLPAIPQQQPHGGCASMSDNHILCISGALHFTSQLRLEHDLSLESIENRAKFLGLNIFHKIHLGLSRPLIKSCMPEVNTNNTRSAGLYKKPRYF